MALKKILVILSVIALLGCTTPAERPGGVTSLAQAGHQLDLNTVYAELGKEKGRVFTLDSKASRVLIYVFRGGRAARMGHNHVLSAPVFTGFVHLPPAGTAGGRFDLEFRLDQLEFDKPEYRSALGGAFASRLSSEAIAATREHMLSEDNLQAARFPIVRIHSLEIAGEAPKFAARILIGMHGREREAWVPLNVDGMPDRLAVTGSLVLRQTDFGVPPYSVLGGMLAVQDAVVIEFRLMGNPAG